MIKMILKLEDRKEHFNMMEIIIDKNTNIDKEIMIVETLKKSIIEDKQNNDFKSLKYHTMALKEHQKTLENLQNKNDLEIEL